MKKERGIKTNYTQVENNISTVASLDSKMSKSLINKGIYAFLCF